MTGSPDRTSNDRTCVWGWAVSMIGHLVGIAVVAAALAAWLTDPGSRAAIRHALRHEIYPAATLRHVGVHLGIAAVVWAMIAVAWRGFRAGDHRASRCRRGAVMLETVIVFPVALVLIMGLAQLAVLNIAATLTDFAGYEAARAAWIWEGERQAGRMGQTTATADVEEYARLQAAMVLTPAAPGAHRQSGDLPHRAERTRGMLVGAQIPVPLDDAGHRGMQMARLLQAQGAGQAPDPGETSFALAIDPGNNLQKTVRKFNWAYRATEVDISTPSDQDIQVDLTYRHFCAFPVVGALFGEGTSHAGREGYFRDMSRSVTRRRQQPADSQWPHWQSGDIDRSLQNL